MTELSGEQFEFLVALGEVLKKKPETRILQCLVTALEADGANHLYLDNAIVTEALRKYAA